MDKFFGFLVYWGILMIFLCLVAGLLIRFGWEAGSFGWRLAGWLL